MRFKKRPQLPGAGRTRAGHHHGSHMPASPEAVLLSKMACQPKHFGRQCIRDFKGPVMYPRTKGEPSPRYLRSPKSLKSKKAQITICQA